MYLRVRVFRESVSFRMFSRCFASYVAISRVFAIYIACLLGAAWGSRRREYR